MPSKYAFKICLQNMPSKYAFKICLQNMPKPIINTENLLQNTGKNKNAQIIIP